MRTEIPFGETLRNLSSKDIYDRACGDREFVSQLQKYSNEVWRSGGGLRDAEVVPCAGSRTHYLPDKHDRTEVIVAGGLAVATRLDEERRELTLFGTKGSVDPYLFLAALQCGGISGSESSLAGYDPGYPIIIPVLERRRDSFIGRDIVMEAGVARELAAILEKELGISK